MQPLSLAHPIAAPLPDLVAVLAARDAAALAQVYDEHQGALCSFCQRLLGDRAAAEDLAHDVFVRLPELIHKLEAGRSLRSFLFGIAANRAKHCLRAASRRRNLARRFAEEPNAPVARPDQLAEQRWIRSRIALALESLPSDQQAAFVLAELEGQDAASIACRLHIPEATARTRLFHARRKLRAILSGWGLVAVFVASAAFAASRPAVRAAVVSCVRALLGHAHRQTAPLRSAALLPRLAVPSPAAEPPPEPISVDSLPLLVPPRTVALRPARSSKPSSLPGSSAADPELEGYRTAHRIHFDGADPGASLRAWDQYLTDFPAASFAPDARFNRALCLIRLGQHAEARAALEPFAQALPGSYRQREAASLLEGLAVPTARPGK